MTVEKITKEQLIEKGFKYKVEGIYILRNDRVVLHCFLEDQKFILNWSDSVYDSSSKMTIRNGIDAAINAYLDFCLFAEKYLSNYSR
jgi:hypothetical protein